MMTHLALFIVSTLWWRHHMEMLSIFMVNLGRGFRRQQSCWRNQTHANGLFAVGPGVRTCCVSPFKTLRLTQNGRHWKAILECLWGKGDRCILTQILLAFFPKDYIALFPSWRNDLYVRHREVSSKPVRNVIVQKSFFQWCLCVCRSFHMRMSMR